MGGNALARKRKPATVARCNARRKAAYLAYVASRGSRCEKCRIIYHSDVYDFHHVDPSNKKFNVNTNWVVSKSTAEGDKCALLCSNCHRLEHQSLRDQGRTTLPAGYHTPDGSTVVVPQEKL